MNTKMRKLTGAAMLALAAVTMPVAAHEPGSPGSGDTMQCDSCTEVRILGILVIRRCSGCDVPA